MTFSSRRAGSFEIHTDDDVFLTCTGKETCYTGGVRFLEAGDGVRMESGNAHEQPFVNLSSFGIVQLSRVHGRSGDVAGY